MNTSRNYDVVRNQPVARFFYQGKSHTHPVRRTVVIIENRPDQFVGYELREGTEVRHFEEAPIKSYRKDRIAKLKNLDKRRAIINEVLNDGGDWEASTLQRTNFLDLVQNGI